MLRIELIQAEGLIRDRRELFTSVSELFADRREAIREALAEPIRSVATF